MLGKLIKYEWKNTYKIGCLVLGAMALITLIGWLAFQTPMWRALDQGDFTFGWFDIFSILTLVMYVVMLGGANLCILIYLGVHFYKTMYTDEGYLTHTLPATKGQILGSKVLVSSLWMVIFVIAMYLSAFLLLFTMLSLFMGDGYTMAGIWRELASGFRDMMRLMQEDLGLNAVRWLTLLVVNVVLQPFTTVATLFGAVSMGQLFAKHRVLMAVVSYIGVLVVNGIVSSLLQSVWTSIGYYSIGSYMNSSMDFGILVDVLLAVILYILSYYVIDKKLNME